MELEGLGVLVGVPGAMTFIPGAQLERARGKMPRVVVMKPRSANVEEANPLGLPNAPQEIEDKTGWPQDRPDMDDPYFIGG